LKHIHAQYLTTILVNP